MYSINSCLILLLFVIALTPSHVTYGDNSYETYVPSRPGVNSDSATDTTEMRRHHPPSMLCMNLQPQHSVNIDQIAGKWHANEIIMHTQDVPGVYRYDSCVTIYLSDVTDQLRSYYEPQHTSYRRIDSISSSSQAGGGSDRVNSPQHHSNTRYIRLIWSEKDDNIEYNFNYTMNHPGLWTNVGEQRGSMVALNKYNQFTGTVQVVKAVSDHLVLTFCSNDLHHSIYTLVVSREEAGLNSDSIRGIRNLLSRRGLYTESIRQVCMKSSAVMQQKSSMVMATILLILICIARKFH